VAAASTYAPLYVNERTAYHEAGHAVGCLVLGHGFECISIVPDEDSYGRITYRRHRLSRLPGVRYREATVGLAGAVAERKWMDDHGIAEDAQWRDAWRADIASARSKVDRDAECPVFAVYVVHYGWNVVTLLAEELLERRYLTRRDVSRLIPLSARELRDFLRIPDSQKLMLDASPNDGGD
jgi:hypothetical protein